MKRLALALMLLTGCSQQSNNQPNRDNVLRIASVSDPESLDPRKARDIGAGSILGMLFEGLMRVDNDGQLTPAAAESVEISPDQLTYTFHLRPATWSNGDPVTAEDFAYTWKNMLSPSFPAPNAFQLFAIKNAKAVKEGHASPDTLGIRVQDQQTLVIQLEKPTPYFLELTAFHALFPINSRIDAVNSGWADGDLSGYSSNGPFIIKHWDHANQLHLVRNPSYWAASDVSLDGVTIVTIEENTALRLFDTRELDWTGSPFTLIPPDAMAALKKSGQLEIVPAAGVQLFRLNTSRQPFDNVKMRRAFALALNRQALIDHVLQGNQQVALAIVPSNLNKQASHYIDDHDTQMARKLFQEALDEIGMTADQLPPITLTYGNNERNQKIVQAVQQQWREAFGVWVKLEGMEPKFYYEKLGRKDYQIANGSWFADFRDPISFLELFKEKANGTNNTEWESAEYRQLLDLSAEADPAQRQEMLSKAETILMSEMPAIPVFFYTFSYVKQPEVKDVGLSELGILNVRNARLEKTK